MFIRKLEPESMAWVFFDSKSLYQGSNKRCAWFVGISAGLVYAEWQGVNTKFMPRTSFAARVLRERHFEATKEVVKPVHSSPQVWLKRQRRFTAGAAFRVAYADYLALIPAYEESMRGYHLAMQEYTVGVAKGATNLSKPKRPREPDEPILGFFLQGYMSD